MKASRGATATLKFSRSRGFRLQSMKSRIWDGPREQAHVRRRADAAWGSASVAALRRAMKETGPKLAAPSVDEVRPSAGAREGEPRAAPVCWMSAALFKVSKIRPFASSTGATEARGELTPCYRPAVQLSVGEFGRKSSGPPIIRVRKDRERSRPRERRRSAPRTRDFARATRQKRCSGVSTTWPSLVALEVARSRIAAAFSRGRGRRGSAGHASRPAYKEGAPL